jgi:hypothetical protein
VDDDAELRVRYRGAMDLDDIVLWRRDPHAAGSDGSHSPVARAAELAPLVYGRADTVDEVRRRDSAAAEAEALLAGWAADVAALDAAIAEMSVAREGRHPAAAADAPLRPRRASRWGRIGLLVGAGALAAAGLIVVGLVVRPSAPTAVRSDLVTSTPTPKPTATITPTPLPAPPPVVVTPEPEDTDLRPDYYEYDIVSVLQVPVNGAPIDNANGVATVDDYGVPLSYVVANGDVFELIAKRFDLGTTYLAGINAVRRENPTELFVGDTINLGATTILRIGDQNGTVYDFVDRLPEPHVPQD